MRKRLQLPKNKKKTVLISRTKTVHNKIICRNYFFVMLFFCKSIFKNNFLFCVFFGILFGVPSCNKKLN